MKRNMSDTKTHYNMVREFMRTFKQYPFNDEADIDRIDANRRAMYLEECAELMAAKTRVEAFDALLDIWYVALGESVEWRGEPMERDMEVVLIDRTFDARMEAVRLALNALPEFGFRIGLIQTHICRILADMRITPEQFHAGFHEVHRSNMSKLWLDISALPELATAEETEGGWIVKSAAGKVLKPATYSPANLGPILEGGGDE